MSEGIGERVYLNCLYSLSLPSANLFTLKRPLFSMCATCGCGVDLGSIEEAFAKNYRCQDCSMFFRGFGYKLRCPRCKSTNTKIAR
jgi:hypothetical protein